MSEEFRKYTKDDVKNIPILDVCSQLGIRVEKRGSSLWCKLRNERTSSCTLHPEKNIYHDFGSNETGDVIKLVCTANNLSFSDAVRWLGDTFGLEPESPEAAKKRRFMMDMRDYAHIGLYGDLATKNFTFAIDRLPPNKLLEIERKFRMSMNQLRKEHPKVYARVLQEKAVPYVIEQQNLYYLDVWQQYLLLKEMKSLHYFYDSDSIKAFFEPNRYEMARSESALKKAVIGTNVKVPEPALQDPIRIATHILQDKLTICLGTHSKEDLLLLVGKGPKSSTTQFIPYSTYMQSDLDDIPHFAGITKDHVELICSAKDLALVNARLKHKNVEEMAEPLDTQIVKARDVTTGAVSAKCPALQDPIR